MGVMRLGYVHLRVTDLEEARDHYSNTLGMQVVHEEPGVRQRYSVARSEGDGWR